MSFPDLGRYTGKVLAGSGVAGTVDGYGTAAQFDLPLGCAASPDGQYLYVSQWNGAIRRVRLADMYVDTIVAAGTYNNLAYMRCGKASGNIYVISVYPNSNAGYGEPHTIYKVSPTGTALGNIGAGAGTYGFDMSADEGTCYITQEGWYQGSSLCIRILGGATIDIAQGSSGAAFQWPSDVALGDDGFFYWSQSQFSEGLIRVKPGVSRTILVNALNIGSPGITAVPGAVLYGGGSLHAYDTTSGLITGPPPVGLPTLAQTTSVGLIIYGTGSYMSPSGGYPPVLSVGRGSDQVWVFRGGGPSTGRIGI